MITRREFGALAGALPLVACTGRGAPKLEPETAPPKWRNGATAPYAVQEIYPTLYRGEVWIAGGFAPELGGATQRVIIYDVAKDQWREGPPLPTPVHHIHLAVVGEQLFAVGGYLAGDSRRDWVSTPRVLKLVDGAWMPGPSLPRPVGEAIPLVHDGRLHLIGGRSPHGEANAAWADHTDISDHFVLRPGAQSWDMLAPLPMARNSHGGAVLNGELHIISGRTVVGGQTDAHHIYSFAKDEWRDSPAFPEPRGGLAATVHGDQIIAGGGEIFRPASVGDSLFAFDGTGWRTFETLPTPRHGHGMIAVNGKLLVFGGAQRVSGDGTLNRLDIWSAPA